jgi:hypothetical protein
MNIRYNAKRLERISHRIKEKIWAGDRASLIEALAEVAETSEIARRLWLAIQQQLKERNVF